MTEEQMVIMVCRQFQFAALLDVLELPSIALFDLVPSPARVTEQRVLRAQRAVDGYAHRSALVERLQEVVRRCREGEYGCSVALLYAHAAGMDLVELGCTKTELSDWYRSFMIQDLRARLEACRRGEYSELGAMLKFIKVALEELWSLGAKFPALPSLPDYNPEVGLPESDRLAMEPITLEDLGTTQEELERFRRMHSLLP